MGSNLLTRGACRLVSDYWQQRGGRPMQALLLLCLALALLPFSHYGKGWSPRVAKPLAVRVISPRPSVEPVFVQALSSHIAQTYRISDDLAKAVVRGAWQAALRTHVPLLLLLAVTSVESSFQPTAHSRAGATGLMQIKLGAHPELDVSPDKLTAVQPNLQAGAQILAGYLQQTGGNVTHALQRYNGARHDRRARYAHKVLARMREFRLATNDVAIDTAIR